MKKKSNFKKLPLKKHLISRVDHLNGGAANNPPGQEADIYTQARTCREDQLSLPHSQCNCWKF